MTQFDIRALVGNSNSVLRCGPSKVLKADITSKSGAVCGAVCSAVKSGSSTALKSVKSSTAVKAVTVVAEAEATVESSPSVKLNKSSRKLKSRANASIKSAGKPCTKV